MSDAPAEPVLSPERRAAFERLLKRKGVALPSAQTIPRRAHDGPCDLSFAQQRLWFIQQLEPASPVLNVPAAMRLRGALDVAAVERSLAAIVRRHEVLRTSVELIDGRPQQVVQPAQPVALTLHDLQPLPASEREAAARALATAEACRPFDLGAGMPLRAALFRLEAETHILLLTIHHIAGDGWSMGVLIHELVTLYRAAAADAAPPEAALPPLPIQYADYALWQRQWLAPDQPAGVLATQLRYWTAQLAGLPHRELPADHPRPLDQRTASAQHSFLLPTQLSAALAGLSQGGGGTLFMTLLAALQVTLHHYTGWSEIVIGTDIANRTRAETSGLIGFFVNQLVLRARLSDCPTFLSVLERAQALCLQAYAHQDLPFEQLVETLNPDRSLAASPLFQVKLILQNTPTPPLSLPELEIEPLEIEIPTSQFDLIFNFTPTDQGLFGALVYARALFEPATIALLSALFQTVLRTVAAQPEIALPALLATLDEEQRRQQRVQARAFEAAIQRHRPPPRRRSS